MEKFDKNNVTSALHVSYAKKEKIYPAYVSKPHKKVENKNVFNIMMPSEDTKKLELINTKNLMNHHLLSMQILNL